jgi:probable sodium:solute symporter
MPRQWIGHLYMFATIVLYATIGVVSRTSNVSEYYVAGRRVPALFNGMATAADWISAASFISLAGTLYLHGFDALAYVMGWTGGYCLVALLIAPYLRRFAQYTIPDFLAVRYGGGGDGTDRRGNRVRAFAVVATIVVSFTYVVAQIYAVGLIASRFTGVDFSVGIFLGLASILVCSFLGGMRAITWTQVAQYIIILVAFLIPTMWLSMKFAGNPVPQVAYGSVLPKLALREAQLAIDPREEEVRARSASAPTNSARSWPACRIPGKPARSMPSAAWTRRAAAMPRWARSAMPNGRWSTIRARPTKRRGSGPSSAAPTWNARVRPSRTPSPSPATRARNRTSAATTSWRWCSA